MLILLTLFAESLASMVSRDICFLILPVAIDISITKKCSDIKTLHGNYYFADLSQCQNFQGGGLDPRALLNLMLQLMQKYANGLCMPVEFQTVGPTAGSHQF